MMHNEMTEAAMLREIIALKDDVIAKKNAEIRSLETLVEVIDQKRKQAEDKHWEECRQIAHYDDNLRKASKVIDAIVEGVL